MHCAKLFSFFLFFIGCNLNMKLNNNIYYDGYFVVCNLVFLFGRIITELWLYSLSLIINNVRRYLCICGCTIKILFLLYSLDFLSSGYTTFLYMKHSKLTVRFYLNVFFIINFFFVGNVHDCRSIFIVLKPEMSFSFFFFPIL